MFVSQSGQFVANGRFKDGECSDFALMQQCDRVICNVECGNVQFTI